jgi:hypothetical protein
LWSEFGEDAGRNPGGRVKNGPKAREAGNREVWSNWFLHSIQALLKV